MDQILYQADFLRINVVYTFINNNLKIVRKTFKNLLNVMFEMERRETINLCRKIQKEN